MAPVPSDGIGDFLWRALAAATVAVALHTADGNAFQARGGPGIQGVFSALLAPPVADREQLGIGATDGELALHVIDFDLGERGAERCVGAGWFLTVSPDWEYFTAMGLRLPDADAPMPLDGDEAYDADTPLDLGPWAGTGLGWRPTQGLRLSIEARWNAEGLSLPRESATHCPFQAGLSLAMDW